MITAMGGRIRGLGADIIGCVYLWADATVVLGARLIRLRPRVRETLDQCYLLGCQSFAIVLFSMLFISLMLITEFSFHMKMVLRQDSLVPAFSTLFLIRELGPVVTCLLLMSRVGASIAAELAVMKNSDQLDALKLLSVSAIDYLVVPRWIGTVFAAVALSLFSLGLGLFGGSALAAVSLAYSVDEFWNSMFVFARFQDLWICALKATVFGTLIPIIAAHHGFHAQKGSEGVGNAATNAVVHGSVGIIIADFLLTYLLYAL